MKSVKHLKTEDEYLDLKNSAEEFCSGVGKRAQWYLVLKSWWSYNYVSFLSILFILLYYQCSSVVPGAEILVVL